MDLLWGLSWRIEILSEIYLMFCLVVTLVLQGWGVALGQAK